jgi:hypothetical protein
MDAQMLRIKPIETVPDCRKRNAAAALLLGSDACRRTSLRRSLVCGVAANIDGFHLRNWCTLDLLIL